MEEDKASTITFSTKTSENVEERSSKKKKKFVYLDKFETYKEVTDERIRQMSVSINIVYAILGVVVTALIVLALVK